MVAINIANTVAIIIRITIDRLSQSCLSVLSVGITLVVGLVVVTKTGLVGFDFIVTVSAVIDGVDVGLVVAIEIVGETAVN